MGFGVVFPSLPRRTALGIAALGLAYTVFGIIAEVELETSFEVGPSMWEMPVTVLDLLFLALNDGRSTRATVVKNATSGKMKTLSLQYKDPAIRVVGDVAIVRFQWIGEAEAVADGKKNSTNLHILMNWQKQGGTWKLLTRAATKL